RRVDLPERQRLTPAEVGVVVTFEVISMARLSLEQAQQRHRYGHTAMYTLDVYIEAIAGAGVRCLLCIPSQADVLAVVSLPVVYTQHCRFSTERDNAVARRTGLVISESTLLEGEEELWSEQSC